MAEIIDVEAELVGFGARDAILERLQLALEQAVRPVVSPQVIYRPTAPGGAQLVYPPSVPGRILSCLA